ncbi:hypothetical protein FIBSPDRAFT_905928 [Athelia psychrophila]|uniref:UTP25 NTP hydrolase-like domain-containing protein n=1 Tax=Athelia psychrophila TaxID=1759441 RepID=A0A167SXY8_9AGAM|nr:hypothetical protein FIBSPDRAFT_905928 [Fibularhizoctonia sp. CBS 109695]
MASAAIQVLGVRRAVYVSLLYECSSCKPPPFFPFVRALVLLGRPAHFAYARSPIPAQEPRILSFGCTGCSWARRTSSLWRRGSRRVWLGNYMKTPRENHNDGFRVEAKTSAKQFLEHYGSDIIIASPLGLRVAIQKEK